MRRVLIPLATLFLSSPIALAFEHPSTLSEPRLLPCPEYGSGFAKIPGTSTCLRVSGRAIAGADLGSGPRATDPVSGRLAIDTRSESDLGPARAFVRVDSGRRLPR